MPGEYVVNQNGQELFARCFREVVRLLVDGKAVLLKSRERLESLESCSENFRMIIETVWVMLIRYIYKKKKEVASNGAKDPP